MKKNILIILLITIFLMSCKETKVITPEKNVVVKKDTLDNITHLQKFLSKKGIMVVKDFYRFGTIWGAYKTKMTFNALVIYEPGKENERTKGLQIEIIQPTSYSEKSEIAFLDVDELEGLSKALGYMVKLKEKWEKTSKEYTEVYFKTKGDFKIGFYKQKKKVATFAFAGYNNSVACLLNTIKKIKSVKEKIDKVITTLNQN